MNPQEPAESFTAKSKVIHWFGGQRPDEYGSKLASDYMVHFDGDPDHLWYRVYQIIYKNVDICYVIRKKNMVIIDRREIDTQLKTLREISKTGV